MKSFAEVMSTLTYWLWRDPTFGNKFSVIVKDMGEWPDGLQKSICREYFDIIETNGHKYFQHKNTKHMERILGMVDRDTPPGEDILKVEYKKFFNRHRVENLASSITRDPENAQKYINKFIENRVDHAELNIFKNMVNDYLYARERKIASGKTKIIIEKFPLLSHGIGGFNPGRVGILLADTGFGKTNLGINLALSASENMGVVYINMEMISYDFTERAVVMLSESNYDHINKELNCSLIESRARNKNLFISDGKDLTLDEIKAHIRIQNAKTKIDFVVIDYDQKIILNLDHHMQEWKALQNAIISLEELAKELECFILVLAQTNEEGAISGSRRSTFSASTVMRFFHDDNGAQDVIQIVKNRFGERNYAISVEYDTKAASVIEKAKTIIVKRKKEFL